MILVITRQQLSILGLEAINTNSEICRHQIFKKVYKRPKIDCKIDIKEMKYFKQSTLMITFTFECRYILQWLKVQTQFTWKFMNI